jgi:sortase (surface protein transpeptidase)
LFTSNGVHMIADLNGWFLGTPSNAVLAPPANPSFGPANPTNLHMPDIGVYTGVGTGSNLDAVANLGIAAQWNNGVQLGSRGNIIMFGHRTTHGAPFRYINLLPYGSLVSLIGDDGHSYNYMVVRQDVTVPDYGVINAIGAASGPATIQLVACTPPGSVRFRVVTTARLVSVT